MSKDEISNEKIDEITMLKQIKSKLQEKNIPIETFIAEWKRLEDLEDDLTTVYMNGFYDGEKKWKDKIREIYEDAISANYDIQEIAEKLEKVKEEKQ